MTKLGDLLAGKGSPLELVRHQMEQLEEQFMLALKREFKEDLKTRAKVAHRDNQIDRKAAIAATKAKAKRKKHE